MMEGKDKIETIVISDDEDDDADCVVTGYQSGDDVREECKTKIREWHSQVVNSFFEKPWAHRNMEGFVTFLKNYLTTYNEIALLQNRGVFQEVVTNHLRFFYFTFASLRRRNSDWTRTYLIIMENILTTWCRKMLDFVSDFRKKTENVALKTKGVAEQLVLCLTQYLLRNRKHIFHVLLNLDDFNYAACKDVLDYVFWHFLITMRETDFSKEQYARSYFLCVKWRKMVPKRTCLRIINFHFHLKFNEEDALQYVMNIFLKDPSVMDTVGNSIGPRSPLEIYFEYNQRHDNNLDCLANYTLDVDSNQIIVNKKSDNDLLPRVIEREIRSRINEEIIIIEDDSDDQPKASFNKFKNKKSLRPKQSFLDSIILPSEIKNLPLAARSSENVISVASNSSTVTVSIEASAETSKITSKSELIQSNKSTDQCLINKTEQQKNKSQEMDNSSQKQLLEGVCDVQSKFSKLKHIKDVEMLDGDIINKDKEKSSDSTILTTEEKKLPFAARSSEIVISVASNSSTITVSIGASAETSKITSKSELTESNKSTDRCLINKTEQQKNKSQEMGEYSQKQLLEGVCDVQSKFSKLNHIKDVEMLDGDIINKDKEKSSENSTVSNFLCANCKNNIHTTANLFPLFNLVTDVAQIESESRNSLNSIVMENSNNIDDDSEQSTGVVQDNFNECENSIITKYCEPNMKEVSDEQILIDQSQVEANVIEPNSDESEKVSSSGDHDSTSEVYLDVQLGNIPNPCIISNDNLSTSEPPLISTRTITVLQDRILNAIECNGKLLDNGMLLLSAEAEEPDMDVEHFAGESTIEDNFQYENDNIVGSGELYNTETRLHADSALKFTFAYQHLCDGEMCNNQDCVPLPEPKISTLHDLPEVVAAINSELPLEEPATNDEEKRVNSENGKFDQHSTNFEKSNQMIEVSDLHVQSSAFEDWQEYFKRYMQKDFLSKSDNCSNILDNTVATDGNHTENLLVKSSFKRSNTNNNTEEPRSPKKKKTVLGSKEINFMPPISGYAMAPQLEIFPTVNTKRSMLSQSVPQTFYAFANSNAEPVQQKFLNYPNYLNTTLNDNGSLMSHIPMQKQHQEVYQSQMTEIRSHCNVNSETQQLIYDLPPENVLIANNDYNMVQDLSCKEVPDISDQVLDLSSTKPPENSFNLPLKKRIVSESTTYSNNFAFDEGISYPATPMISIAELDIHSRKEMQANTTFNTIKIASERREMPQQFTTFGPTNNNNIITYCNHTPP